MANYKILWGLQKKNKKKKKEKKFAIFIKSKKGVESPLGKTN